MELQMSEHHHKFQNILKSVNLRDAELRKNVWQFQQMQNASLKSAEQIRASVQDVEQICQAQRTYLEYLDELEKLMDREE